MIFTKKFIQKASYLLVVLSMSIFIPKQNAYAEEAYVYCAADKDNWYWLNNKTVKVTGEWRIKKIGFTTYIRFFKIDGGCKVVQALQQQCKQEFGYEYKYAQPADNILSGWFLFSVENGKIIEGINDFSKQIPRIGK
ncbi:hypothetical protein [Fluviispira vulneris]|uniref:hypothetical protein n=1 Tax=Fluviispira vulneris TaxID=2763012 RepID=UPI0016490998|nr:hypothetical protein [Fluviispira vulneris]